MSWCTAEPCRRGEGNARQISENERHSFAGYGYYNHYHPECCPGAFDGSRCFQDHDGHPEGWQPEDPDYYERCGL